MPVTSLDPKTALIVIDLQKGILAPSAGSRTITARAGRLPSAPPPDCWRR
jgi:nicotinamidase-related amidase